MPPIAVAIDTSGSIDRVTLTAFATELSAIRDEVHPASTVLIYADCAVQRVEVVRDDDPIALTPIGGGGTAFGPAITTAEQHDEGPCCLVYLTDLDGKHRPDTSAIPLLWVVPPGSPMAPYGERLELS